MGADEFFLALLMLHEDCHVTACNLLRVRVKEARFKGRGDTRIIVEDPGSVKLFFIKVFPWLFDLLFGLRFFRGLGRIMWLKFWIGTRKHFAKGIISELES